MNVKTHVEHGFGPLYDENSEILILGSFPSVLSREQGFFYGNPRNRFWAVLEALCGEAVPEDVEGRRAYCIAHRIALYDAIESCDIVGSKDDSIENVVPADIQTIVKNSRIKRVILNGNAAKRHYLAFQSDIEGVQLYFMPSTSPANAAWSLKRLIDVWKTALY